MIHLYHSSQEELNEFFLQLYNKIHSKNIHSPNKYQKQSFPIGTTEQQIFVQSFLGSVRVENLGKLSVIFFFF